MHKLIYLLPLALLSCHSNRPAPAPDRDNKALASWIEVSHWEDSIMDHESHYQDIDPTHVIVDGDEMPGIGALENNPDTALVYFNQKDRRIHIKYLTPSK